MAQRLRSFCDVAFSCDVDPIEHGSSCAACLKALWDTTPPLI